VLEPAHIAAQPTRLLALVAGQALGTAGSDVALAAPVPKRLLRDAQLIGDLLERRPRPHQLDRLAAELRRIRRSGSWHLDILPARALRPKRSSVHETGVNSSQDDLVG
jgi:hypothetical protein